MINRLMEDLKKSMQEKDKFKKEVLQLVVSKAKNLAKEDLKDVDDSYVIRAIKSELKQTQEAFEMMKEKLSDDAKVEYRYKINVLGEYLPQQMNKEETISAVKFLMASINVEKDIKNMGLVMRLLREDLGDKVDGKMLSEIVKEQLLGE